MRCCTDVGTYATKILGQHIGSDSIGQTGSMTIKKTAGGEERQLMVVAKEDKMTKMA